MSTTRRPPRQAPTGATRRPRTLFERINYLVNRLPIPTPGRFGTLIAIGVLFAATVGLALICAGALRNTISTPGANRTSALPTTVPNATPNPSFLAPTVDIGNAYQWQGNDRVTVLLMGADTRPSERGINRPRSDTMILLMVDPATKHASILSIPRDLYVDIPGYGLNRINAAYFFGGGDLAVSTVEYNLGVRVNMFALIEFNVFVRLVDEIGGVDVVNEQAIYDDSYPTYDFGYQVFSLPAGPQHLDGETALKYVRTRHGNSDFDRIRRQQQVIFAIRDKVLSLNMLPSLIQKAPGLYSELKDDIDTDMTLDQMIRLAVLAKDIPKENIRNAIIGANYVLDYTTPDGADVEIPNRANIGELLAQVFWLK